MPRFDLFSTREDYERLVESYEVLSSLYFVEDTVYYGKDVPSVKGLLSLPDLGIVKGNRRDPYDRGHNYYVFREEPKLGVRSLMTIDGQKRFALDGSTFSMGLWFKSGGVVPQEKIVISGYLEVTNPLGDTLSVYREIAKCFSKEYIKAKYFKSVYYVGHDALALQRKRYRLCANPNLSRSDDFNPKKHIASQSEQETKQAKTSRRKSPPGTK